MTRRAPRGGGRTDAVRKLTAWGAICAVGTVLGLVTGVPQAPQAVCAWPGVHALCRVNGWGGVARPQEQADWDAARAATDHRAVQAYLSRYPDGVYAREALAKLASCQPVEKATYRPETHRAAMMVRPGLEGFASPSAARADALSRGAADAKRLCAGYAAGEYRLTRASLEPTRWDCAADAAGHYCALDGFAVCEAEAKVVDLVTDCRPR